jgi:para-nitrobenzyl esterase
MLFAAVVTERSTSSGPNPVIDRGQTTPVNVSNFIRAETDLYFARTVKKAGLGRLHHARQMTPIDQQDVVRMNRDTLYSAGVFDLDAAPVTVVLPDSKGRFLSMQILSEDHYTIEVVYAPGRHTYTRDRVGTRYAYVAVRTVADQRNPSDMKAARALQDEIKIEQARVGRFEVPRWDQASQAKIRSALEILGTALGAVGPAFGAKNEVDPVRHMISTAIGWGGNPVDAAVYRSVVPPANDGKTVHRLTLKDVPVAGFWSVSVYNERGYFEKNELDAYALTNLTARPDATGAFTVQFGDCRNGTPNCLPIVQGWSYTVRLYQPRPEILGGTWKFPEALPMR